MWWAPGKKSGQGVVFGTQDGVNWSVQVGASRGEGIANPVVDEQRLSDREAHKLVKMHAKLDKDMLYGLANIVETEGEDLDEWGFKEVRA